MNGPTFLGIGAMKCGTTSLHGYLSSHPQVYVPITKELHFFKADDPLPESLGEYRNSFPVSYRARGEISPSYTQYLPTIAEALPGIPILYCLRDPVERFRSALQHLWARGEPNDPRTVVIDRILDDPSRAWPWLVRDGFYDRTVAELRALRLPYLLIGLRNIVDHPQSVWDTVCDFIEVDRVESVTGPLNESPITVKLTEGQTERLRAMYRDTLMWMADNGVAI